MNLSSARQGSSSVCLALQFSAPFVLLINRCCAGQLYVSSENVNRKCKHTERGTVCENVAEEKGIFAAINGWYFKPDTVQNRICCWMMRSVVCACVVFSYSFRLEDEKSSIISLFKHACIKMCGVDFICNAFFPFFGASWCGIATYRHASPSMYFSSLPTIDRITLHCTCCMLKFFNIS